MSSLKLSIIIVNYNVRYFLENCLHSVKAAIKDIDAEVIIVDNASGDHSAKMVSTVFPEFEFIQLNENVGFSRGNNVGIERAKGEYILLLNPDTVVQENSFSSCIKFMEEHPDAGGLGVKMIEGHGNFLPESKRGLPTPTAAFYKIFGFSSLFPKSKKFGKYHLGYLNENETHEVEVLSGAYMMMPKKVLDKIGLLDEQFFMYGEDIDLSYRIIQGGYKNFYFSGTSIIHYKGESTKKGSVNYVFVFYKAMVIFARKHFDRGKASLFSNIINSAIYFRAFLALLRRLVGRQWKLIFDFLVTYLAFYVSANLYETYGSKDFSQPFIAQLLPLYSFFLALVLQYSGAHDRPFRIRKLLYGWLVGIILLLAVYALFPEDYRFSRAVVLLGSIGGLSFGLLWRGVAAFISPSSFQVRTTNRRLVIGNESSLAALKNLIIETEIDNEFLAGLTTTEETYNGCVGSMSELEKASSDFRVDEVYVDNRCVQYADIIKVVALSKSNRFSVKILNGNWAIGSQEVLNAHKYVSGNRLFKVNVDSISRSKRAFDVLFSLIILTFSPIAIWFVDNKAGFISNIFSVLFGTKSWIGFDPRGMDIFLPKLKAGIIHPSSNIIWNEGDHEHAFEANVAYLFAPRILRDLQLVAQHFHSLGN